MLSSFPTLESAIFFNQPKSCLPALLDMLRPVIGSFPEATVVETGEIDMTFLGVMPRD